MSTSGLADHESLVESLTKMWGTDVVRGNDGLLHFEPRPRGIMAMLYGVERWGERDFLVHEDRRVTFDRFLRAVRSSAHWLRKQDVAAGDRVMVLSYNRPEFVLAVWSSWWLGAVPVLANRWWSGDEVKHALDICDPRLILRDQGGPDIRGDAPILPIGELGDILDRPGEVHDVPDAHLPSDEHEEALILFTSGSSGAPKGVALSQASVVANQHNLLMRSRQLPQSLDAEAPQAVMLTCTPMFHIGGVANLVTQLLVGGRLVMNHGRFDPGQVLELIEREGVHRWGGVPTMAARVLEHPDLETRDLSSLRSFPLGGAPVTKALLERMARKLPQLKRRGLANTWGMTESGGFVTVAGNREIEQRPGTVGRPYEVVELRISNPDNRGRGEILVRTPTNMEGYLGSEGGALDENAWLHTGDLGHLDEDGYLFLDGRIKEIVIRGGENIACAHVEKAILAHPDVVEAAVFGIPDEDLGEQLAAAVTRRAGTDLNYERLLVFLQESLAHFEIPSVVRVQDDPLPTLAGEKVNKPLLRSELAESILS